jgi:hypothetical protein
MKRFSLCIHFGSVLFGYLAICIFPATACTVGAPIALLETATVCGVAGFLSGLGQMVIRKGKNESITIAASTIAAFVLLLLAM